MTNVDDLINFFNYVSGVQGRNSLLYSFIAPKGTPSDLRVYDRAPTLVYVNDLYHPTRNNIARYLEGNHRVLLYPHHVKFSGKHETSGIELWSNQYLQEINFVILDIDVHKNFKNGLDRSNPYTKKYKAKVLAERIFAYLEAAGYKKMMLVDSGNGYHVFIPIRICLRDVCAETAKIKLIEYFSRCKSLADAVKDKCYSDEFTGCVDIDSVFFGNIKQMVKSPGSVNRKHWDDHEPRVSKIIHYKNGTDGKVSISTNTDLFELIEVEPTESANSKDLIDKIVYRDFIEHEKVFQISKKPEIQSLLNLYRSLDEYRLWYRVAKYDRSKLEFRLLLCLLSVEDYGYPMVNMIMSQLLCDIASAKWLERNDGGYRRNQYERALQKVLSSNE